MLLAHTLEDVQSVLFCLHESVSACGLVRLSSFSCSFSSPSPSVAPFTNLGFNFPIVAGPMGEMSVNTAGTRGTRRGQIQCELQKEPPSILSSFLPSFLRFSPLPSSLPEINSPKQMCGSVGREKRSFLRSSR